MSISFQPNLQTGGAAPGIEAFTPQQLTEISRLLQTSPTLQVSRTDGASPGAKPADGTTELDAPILDADDIALLLQSVRAKLGNQQLKMAQEGVQANATAQKQAHDERLQKLNEAAEAAEKARTSGLLGKIFGWIGVAVAVIAAVAVTIATFGAAAPASALAIAGCVAAIAGAVLAGVTQTVMSIPGAMEGMGKDGSQAFMFTMMALQILAAVVSLGAGAGSAVNAGKATVDAAKDSAQLAQQAANASKLGEAAAKGADLAEDAAALGALAAKTQQQASTLSNVADIVGGAAKAAGGLNSVASGTNQIYGAVHTAEAENLKADAAEFQKLLKQLQQTTENETEFVKTIQEMIDRGAEIVASVANDSIAASSAVARQMRA